MRKPPAVTFVALSSFLSIAISCSGSPALSCEIVADTWKNQTFVVGRTTMRVVSTKCDGVSTDGKSGKALFTATAEAVSSPPFMDTEFARAAIAGKAVDPFTPNGEYVPRGTRFEIKMQALYTLYDTGWKLDSHTVTEGRRL